jgi:hypothetical protein
MPIKPIKPSFSKSAKIRLIEREMTVGQLAEKIGFNRWNVSLTIHQRRRFPRIEAAIRKELDLEGIAA